MKTYMTDTHSLLWAFTRPGKLGDMARKAFNEVAEEKASLLVPVIVLAELIFTVENKPVRANLDEILRRLQRSPNVRFIDLDLQTILQLQALTSIPEMHARIIVTEARKHNAALITMDETVTASGLVDVVW